MYICLELEVMNINKKEIQVLCIQMLERQLSRLEDVMRHAQLEANKETKSSAGDKYETGRSMMQLEKEKYAIQHSRVSQQLGTLKKIDLSDNQIANLPSAKVFQGL